MPHDPIGVWQNRIQRHMNTCNTTQQRSWATLIIAYRRTQSMRIVIGARENCVDPRPKSGFIACTSCAAIDHPIASVSTHSQLCKHWGIQVLQRLQCSEKLCWTKMCSCKTVFLLRFTVICVATYPVAKRYWRIVWAVTGGAAAAYDQRGLRPPGFCCISGVVNRAWTTQRRLRCRGVGHHDSLKGSQSVWSAGAVHSGSSNN